MRYFLFIQIILAKGFDLLLCLKLYFAEAFGVKNITGIFILMFSKCNFILCTIYLHALFS